MEPEEFVKKSKKLSYLLRHSTSVVDSHGWASYQSICDALCITYKDLVFLVVNDSKGRYQFNSAGTMVRAVQGHSINVDLGLYVSKPPDLLYHGTAHRSLKPIFEQGLKNMTRQYVHLSEYLPAAELVSARRFSPVILKIDSASMYSEGFDFYCADNGVWLTLYVPSKFIQVHR